MNCLMLSVWSLLILILTFCQNMTQTEEIGTTNTTGSSSSSGTGLKVICNATGKTVEIKPSIANSTNIHHIIVQNGLSFNCMCSVLNNLSSGNIRWKSKELNLNQTLSNSGKSLLTVSQVGWTLNDSVFECGLDHGGNGVPGVAFRLVVGDRPGPPLDLVASPYYQGLRLDWRAALITGGLPVSYSVKSSVLYRDYDFGDCFNFNPACLELPDETDPKKRFVHERGKLYSCVVLMNADFTELDYINCFYGPYTYKVWITAENEVGSANSFVGLDVIPEHYKYSNTVIHAPGDVRPKEIRAHGFTVLFGKGKFWRVDEYEANYGTELTLFDNQGNVVCGYPLHIIGVTYRKLKTPLKIYEKNSTIELPLKQGSPSVKVNGLKPYTRYKVRLRVRIERKDNLDCTSYSRPAYITVVTKQAAPSLAPLITSCNQSDVLANNTEMRYTNISWQKSPNGTWNSPWLSGFVLIYVESDKSPLAEKEHTIPLDNTTSHKAIQVKLFGTYNVWMKACNAKGQCSKRGLPCRIPSLGRAHCMGPQVPFMPLPTVHPPFAQGSANNNQLLKTSLGLVVPVIVVLLIVAALVYWRYKKTPQPRRLPDCECSPYTEDYTIANGPSKVADEGVYQDSDV